MLHLIPGFENRRIYRQSYMDSQWILLLKTYQERSIRLITSTAQHIEYKRNTARTMVSLGLSLEPQLSEPETCCLSNLAPGAQAVLFICINMPINEVTCSRSSRFRVTMQTLVSVTQSQFTNFTWPNSGWLTIMKAQKENEKSTHWHVIKP